MRLFLTMTEETEIAMDKISFGPCKDLEYWMMPFNGTVGKYSHPLSEVLEIFQRRANVCLCQHADKVTREFLVAFVLDLRRRLL